MLSVKDVREFLELGWFPALVGFIASCATLALDYYKVPYYSGAPSWVLVAAACLSIACGAIITAHIVKLLIACWRMWKAHQNAKRLKRITLDNLRHVNEAERYILSYYFSTNQRIFHAPFDYPVMNSLKAKRLVLQHPGHHDISEWPFSFVDAVWEEMMREAGEWTLQDTISNKPSFRRL